MESQGKIVYLTQNEVNFQLIQIAESYGMADEVSTSINKSFITKYTRCNKISAEIANIIFYRYRIILEEAREYNLKYRDAISKLID